MWQALKSFFSDLTLRKKSVICLVAGLALRFVFMPLAFHRDLLWINVFASRLALEGVFDIYGFIEKHYPAMVQQGINYYPPLSYFLLGGFHLLFKWFAPGLGMWLTHGLGILVAGDEAGYRQLLAIPFSRLASYITLMKVPFAFFDLFCLMILLALIKPLKSSFRIFRLWMINPVVIFGSYIFGQFDILVACFLLGALYMISKGRLYWGVFILGAAVLLKTSPIVLILPISMLVGRDIKERIGLVLTALLPVAIMIIPLYLVNGTYVLSSLFPNLLSGAGATKLDTLEFLIGKLIFASGYAYILCLLWQRKNLSGNMAYDGWRYMLSVMLFSYFIVYTPVHYFQWVIPLMIVGIVNGNIPLGVYVLQIVCLFVYALNSRPLGGQLFLGLAPEHMSTLKSIPEYMNQFMSWGVVMRTARFIFHACSLYIIWKLIFKPEVTVHG